MSPPANKEMRAACRRARIDGVVDALPAGLDTLVGELADPRVLVLAAEPER